MTEEQCKRVVGLHERGMVVLPTRCKFPRGVSGWQKLEKSYLRTDGDLWEKATGFGIQTGKRSGVTVIDVDKPDREWFDKFWAQSGLAPTMTVETPSGGLHLYYKYDARLKQTQGFAGVSIDIRNDGGLIVAPGSPYDTNKADKKQFIGTEYVFAKNEAQQELDWDYLRPLDEIWVQFQEQGVDKETFKPKQRPVVREQTAKKGRQVSRPVRTFCSDYVIRETEPGELLKLMLTYGKQYTTYEDWVQGIWVWCQVARDNDFDALEWADKWSQQLPGYEGIDDVGKKVSDWDANVSNNFNVAFIMNKLGGTKVPVAREYMKQTNKKYYYSDYRKMIKKAEVVEGLPIIPITKVEDYLRSAIILIDRTCTVTYYLRTKKPNEPDQWVMASKTPFAELPAPFAYQSTIKDENGHEVTKTHKTSFRSQLINKRLLLCEDYSDIVYIPYYGPEAPEPEGTFNSFSCYHAQEVFDEKVDPEVQTRLDLVNKHWLETMCNGNEKMYDYVKNWQSFLLQKGGTEKLRTMLVFIGKQGTGKNLMWETFFLRGIVGKWNGGVYANLARFMTNFNAERLHKILHIFNEVSSQAKSRVNADRVKALIDPDFICERKGKERFRARDPAGCVFLSNHAMPVKIENWGRRYAATEMSNKYAGAGHKAYWDYLVTACKDTRVQDMYFTELLERDIDEWNMSEIPETKARERMREDKLENTVLKFLWDVVNYEKADYSSWYRRNLPLSHKGEKTCWFRQDTVKKAYLNYCKEQCISSVSFNHIHKKISSKFANPRTSNLLVCKRVWSREAGEYMKAERKASTCYLIDKVEVVRLTREVLGVPDWQFPEEKITVATIQDVSSHTSTHAFTH